MCHIERKRLLKQCQNYLAKLGLEVIATNALQLTQGVNNTCFRVDTQCGSSLVIKHFDKENTVQVAKVEQRLAKLKVVPRVLALNDTEKLIAYQYIENQGFNKKVHLATLVTKLKQLHQLTHNDGFATINIEQLFDGFTALDEFVVYQSDISDLLGRLRTFPAIMGLCHNDLVLENLLFAKADSWIIDFEYIGLNDVYFDLAALSSSLQFNLDEKRQLLGMYFEQSKIDIAQLEKLNNYQQAYNFICYFWYLKHGFTSHALALKPFIND